MPAAFPSHAAAVLPLKMRWPAAFDGVALVIGSTAPDQAYAWYIHHWLAGTHQWSGLLWWCLPVTLIETFLVRRAAPIVAAHLPAGGWFALADYGAIGRHRYRWLVTVYSALLGAVTHLVWDGLAHAPDGPGWGRDLLPFLDTPAIDRWGYWRYAQPLWSLIGGVIAVALFARIGRRRLVRAWDGDPPPAPLAPGLFWSVTLAVAAGYPWTWSELSYRWSIHVQGVRLLWYLGVGLLCAAAAVAAAERIGQRRAARETTFTPVRATTRVPPAPE
jgi:hypothetical protein